MKDLLYCDLTSGISGNMFTNAILDFWQKESSLKSKSLIHNFKNDLYIFCKSLPNPIREIEIDIQHVTRKGMYASALEFKYIENNDVCKTYKEIQRNIIKSNISQHTKEYASKIFKIIEKAQLIIHNKNIDSVYFYDPQGDLALLQVIASAHIYYLLEMPPIYSTSVCLPTKGGIQFSNANISNPVPTVLEILKNTMISYANEEVELTSPIGAAIIKALNFNVDIAPTGNLFLDNIGYGAGQLNLLNKPNVLRICLLNHNNKNIS